MTLPTGVPDLFPFQKRLLATAHSGKYRTLAWSMPRGNSKSFLAARLLLDFIWPDSPHFVNNKECLCLAASLDQARIVFRYLREWLEPSGQYRFGDSPTAVTIKHKSTNTQIRAISSKAKTAMGIVGVPWVIADEPGAWEVTGGQLMQDAIQTAQGKYGSDLRVLYIGTRAPAMDGWWIDLLDRGTDESRSLFVYNLAAHPKKWDTWREIKRVNPLTAAHPDGVAVLKAELQEAHKDPRLKAQFLSYRLNIPAGDESTVLLTVDDIERVVDRIPGPQEGHPVIGIDMGAGRAWSACVAWWPSQRIEAFAICPGIPPIIEQEERDIVPRGAYQALVDQGLLLVAEGYRIPPAFMIVQEISRRWGPHLAAVSDRFREKDLLDAGMAGLTGRVTQWSEASFDIRALRRAALDGMLSIGESRPLVEASLAQALVEHDKAGNMRLVKKGFHNTARDDVAAARHLAARLTWTAAPSGAPSTTPAAGVRCGRPTSSASPCASVATAPSLPPSSTTSRPSGTVATPGIRTTLNLSANPATMPSTMRRSRWIPRCRGGVTGWGGYDTSPTSAQETALSLPVAFGVPQKTHRQTRRHPLTATQRALWGDCGHGGAATSPGLPSGPIGCTLVPLINLPGGSCGHLADPPHGGHHDPTDTAPPP